MIDLNQFNRYWKFGGQRGAATQRRYEEVLFSIWANHRDNDGQGFSIKCIQNTPEYNTICRVVDRAIKSGLLIQTSKYQVNVFSRHFHKNDVLFNTVFKSGKNKYKDWLSNRTIENDIILKLSTSDNRNYQSVTIKTKKDRTKTIKLNYDIDKLRELSNGWLSYYRSKVDELNAAAIDEGLKFTKSSFLRLDDEGMPKGRPTSFFCSTLNDKKAHKNNNHVSRRDYLDSIGLTDYGEVYDIKSEVPRVNYLFHNGAWKDDNYDFYSEIIKDAGFIDTLYGSDDFIYVQGDTISRGGSEYSHYNDSMKQLFMRIYFRDRGRSEEWNYGRYKIDRVKRIKKEGGGVEYFKRAIENREDLNFDVWNKLCNSVDRVCGLSIGNLIWWYCFMIETEVKIELLGRGKAVYNVYDGFYYDVNDKSIKDEIEKLLIEKSAIIYEKYMKCVRL
jgi:hypothetical protein